MIIRDSSKAQGLPPSVPSTVAVACATDGGLRLLLALWRSTDKVHQISSRNLQTRVFTNMPVKDAAAALEQARAMSANGLDTYLALAEYLDGSSRRADNVAGAYAFWFDVDVGLDKGAKGKGYATLDDAKAALTKFYKDTGLTKQTHIVLSGAGLHVYWALEQFVDRATWQEYAAKLKLIAQWHGFLADPSRTADIASVLRIPGTLNHKYTPALPVTLVFAANALIPNAMMFGALNAAFEKGRPEMASVPVVAPAPVAVSGPGPVNQAPALPLPDVSAYGPPDLKMLASALTVLDPDCDDRTWKFHRLAPIARIAREHPELAHEAYALAKSWSSGELRGSPSNAWTTPAQSNGLTGAQVFDAQWKRFLQPNPSGKQSSVGTIYFHAKELGWTWDAHSTPQAGTTAPAPAMPTASPVIAPRVALPASLQVQSAPTPTPTPALASHAMIEQQITALPVALAPTVTPETDAKTVARLASLTPTNYDRARKQEAKALGVQVKTLDQMVKNQRATTAPGDLLPFQDVAPWPEPIAPAALLDEICATILRYVVMDPEQAVTVALWSALTWFADEVEVLPLLIFTAPEKECGKSEGLSLVGKLAARPMSTANSSTSFVFRAITRWKPTLLVDEADTFVKNNDEFKGLVNAGHTRANAFIGRAEAAGEGFEPVLLPVWCPKCFAGIKMENHFPAATMSRSHVINMRRKLPHEKVERRRYAPAGLFETLSAKLARFAEDYADQVRSARPVLPDALGDRQQDNWEPLLAIAQCAGSEWFDRATQAALAMCKPDESGVGSSELLADIQEVFQQKRTFKITTVDLIAALVSDAEKAWGTYNRGRPLTPRQLAKQLAAYGIQPKTVRMQDGTPKGYDADQFADAFRRYLAQPETVLQRPNTAPEAAYISAPALACTTPALVPQSTPIDELDCELDFLDACGGVADTSVTPVDPDWDDLF